MRILLDECVPRRLKHLLPGHEVRTVGDMGWSGKKNGELLQLLKEHQFDVLLTTDRNVRFQQNLQAAGVAVLVLVAASNRLSNLTPLMPSAISALVTIRPADVVEVTG